MADETELPQRDAETLINPVLPALNSIPEVKVDPDTSPADNMPADQQIVKPTTEGFMKKFQSIGEKLRGLITRV